MSCPDDSSKELDEKHVESIVKLVSEVRIGKLEESNDIASATVTLLENIINDSQNATAYELCTVIKEVGRRLTRALPHELVIANMVRRVLRAVRDEHRIQSHQTGEGGAAGEGGRAGGGGGAGGESLQRLVQVCGVRRATLGAGAAQDLREPLRDHLAELRLELESSCAAICGMAREHVQADELILAAGGGGGGGGGGAGGGGGLLERFLLAAARRRYRLLLAETAHRVRQTHAMALRLSEAGVSVTVISNASVYAVMSRVNKVVLGARAALAGGAALADAGALAVSLAAKHYSVPVLVVSPLSELSPLHAQEPRLLAALAAPAAALPYRSECQGAARVFAPRYDCVPPDHVTLFLTNLGGSSPSYVYRLLSELYDPNDYQI